MTDVMTGGGLVPPTGTPTSGSPPVSPVGTGTGSVGNQVQTGGSVGGLTGFTTQVYTPPPRQTPFLDASGSVSRVWLNWFQAISNLVANTYPPVIGEYRVEVSANLLDDTWLLCNGATPATASYPKLSALLGGSGGTFTLPTIASGSTSYTFVKAL